MARTLWPEFQALPDGGGNFLYVAQFAPDVLKVGYTCSPRERMKQYAREFRRNRSSWRVRRVHVEPTSLLRATANERELVERLCRIATPLAGHREFFTGANFGAAVTLIRQIAHREYIELDALDVPKLKRQCVEDLNPSSSGAAVPFARQFGGTSLCTGA